MSNILKTLGKIADNYTNVTATLENLLFYSNQNAIEQHELNRKNEELFGRTGLERLAMTWVPGVYIYWEFKKVQSSMLNNPRDKIKRYGVIITVEFLLDATRIAAVYAQYRLYQLL